MISKGIISEMLGNFKCICLMSVNEIMNGKILTDPSIFKIKILNWVENGNKLSKKEYREMKL